jgi:hypothetical protein
MSFGTSKLGHYAYPFLPAFALAAAYSLCWILEITRAPTDRLVKALDERAVVLGIPLGLRLALVVACAASATVALVTLAYGGFELHWGTTRIVSNRWLLRPTVLALICGILGARRLAVPRAALVVALCMLLPIPVYRLTLSQILVERHTYRSARACVLEVRDRERQAGRATPALLDALPPGHFIHSFYYYLRDAGYDWADPISDDTLAIALHSTGAQRPVLLPLENYLEFAQRRSRGPERPPSPALSTWAGAMPAVDAWIRQARALTAVDMGIVNVQLLLPGPYAVCGSPLAVGPLLPTSSSAITWR